MLDASLLFGAIDVRLAVVRCMASLGSGIACRTLRAYASVRSGQIEALGRRVTGHDFAFVDVETPLGSGDETVGTSAKARKINEKSIAQRAKIERSK